jgi:hypothetical protein
MKPFSLLIWAIVAILLIFIATNIYNNLFPESNLTNEIKEELGIAQSQPYLGELRILGQKTLEEGDLIMKDSFDLLNKSVAIECTSADICCPLGEECNNSIEWNYELLNVKNTTTTRVYVRCITEENLPVCRIYFGTKPAQASIKQINLISSEGNSTVFNLTVENSGNNTLPFGEANIELYQKVNGQFQKLGIDLPTQNINNLPASQEHDFIFNIETFNTGQYRAKFIFSGNNAGFDTFNYDFNVGINQICTTSSKTESIEIFDEELNSQGYYEEEFYYCNNCNFAYECLSEWQKEHQDINFNIISKERVSCYSKSLGSTCLEEN